MDHYLPETLFIILCKIDLLKTSVVFSNLVDRAPTEYNPFTKPNLNYISRFSTPVHYRPDGYNEDLNPQNTREYDLRSETSEVRFSIFKYDNEH